MSARPSFTPTAEEENFENQQRETKARFRSMSFYRINPLAMYRQNLDEIRAKTKSARELIGLCLREQQQQQQQKKNKKKNKKSTPKLSTQLSLFILLEILTQKSSTETFKKSSQAWTSIATGKHADAIRPILEHLLYFGMLSRPLATSAGYVKMNIERWLVESRAAEATAKRLFERRRLLDLESVLDEDDDECGKMKRTNEGDVTLMFLRVLMEAEDIVAFGIPMACERACYAGFGLIESMVALAYHGEF